MSLPCEKAEDIGILKADTKTIKNDLSEIKKDVKSLLRNKWQDDGKKTILGGIVGGLFTLVIAYFFGN